MCDVQNWLVLMCWCLSLAPVAVVSDTHEYEKCLKDRPAVYPQKYPHFQGLSVEVVLTTSHRELHQLSTEIFRIFLVEVLGFKHVRIIKETDNFNITDLIDTLSPSKDENIVLPKAMVNLEVWLEPEIDVSDLEDATQVREFGKFVPAGRFGWFIPEELQEPIKRFYGKKWDRNIREVHWSMFRDPLLVTDFDITGKDLRTVTDNLIGNQTNNFSCFDPTVCQNGLYTPEQCVHNNCALLLTSDYDSMKFVIEHITELKLYVRVAFLGNKLKQTVKQLKSSYTARKSDKSFLILHYTPGEIILREKNFISVTFKNCELLSSTKNVGCRYGLNRVAKLAWNKIEKIGLLAPVRNFRFDEYEYDGLLSLYESLTEKRFTVQEIACAWMNRSEDIWRIWKIESDTSIYIGGIFPIHSSSYNGAGIVAGALLARDRINNSTDILPNYKLQLIVSDGKCRPDKVMKAFIDYIVDGYYNNLVGVLGPACSDTVEPLAGVSKHYRIMVISYSAEGASFKDREKYPFFFRTIGENKHYEHVYLRMFKQLGWARVAALTEDGQKYTEYISHMKEMLEENGITCISNKFPRERETLQMTRYLEELQRKRARIIILDVFDEIARTVMCEASRLKMTSADGYVWFLPTWLNTTWYDTDYFNEYTKEFINCTTAQMIKAANGYFSMAHSYYAEDDDQIQGNMTVAEWKKLYKLKARKGTSDYAGYAYDAVWTYALALDKLIKADPEGASDLHSENTTAKLVKLIKDTDFYGVSGRIKFRGGPSRFSVINLMQWYDNQSHIVGQFVPNLTDDKPDILGGNLTLTMSALKWFTPDGKKPGDGTPPPPVCTLESLAKFFSVDCEMAIVVLNLLVGSVVILLVTAAIYLIKRRYDKKVQDTQKYYRHLGIDFLINSPNFGDLDKWEIARNSVVINRKLGEGAFGTVYGGEAKLADKGWVAVAVKTLKVGSSTEEKVDFLSEAEVMKRLNHNNIIKLLGVCTKEEPVYTIMEFMLYGDLKTFLLARRHLVNDKTIEESDEISSKKLTGMALDVARGLGYLASLKYVHRDVACRNCLVNAQRVVKLGDFGMTRPMLENDYYRFTRKGMLPVRWMSPESLALGVFTPASDVWSYGVLLYEIITFGSFPYQGMNNQEVLEFVKNGNTIKIPDGVKPQLKCLLKSCWQQDAKTRVRASEIVDFLANNPRLLSPCLDVPLSSVQLEDTDQDIHLPDQFRKCSTSDIKSSPSIPNGIASHSLDHRISSLREDASHENGVSIPLENCCPKEPLLGPAKSTSSLLNFGKYVSLQHNCENKENDDDGEYLTHNPNNGFVVSEV